MLNLIIDWMMSIIATELLANDHLTANRLNSKYSAVLLFAAPTGNDFENRHGVEVG